MSREIKFRAWDKESRGWIYSKPMPDMSFWKWVQYDSTTIFNESTGLKDKNGVEIYEGDIVKEPDSWGATEPHHEVRWALNGGWWLYQGEYSYDSEVAIEWEEMEVIGYIYENPELLKAEDKV